MWIVSTVVDDADVPVRRDSVSTTDHEDLTAVALHRSQELDPAEAVQVVVPVNKYRYPFALKEHRFRVGVVVQ